MPRTYNRRSKEQIIEAKRLKLEKLKKRLSDRESQIQKKSDSMASLRERIQRLQNQLEAYDAVA